MTHGHYIILSYAWDQEGRGMVVLNNPQSSKSSEAKINTYSPPFCFAVTHDPVTHFHLWPGV